MHTPQAPGKPIKVNKISVAKWDNDGNFTLNLKVATKPKLSASKKCYMYAFKHGETDIVVNVDGVDRKVRMTFMLYSKVPASERRQTLEAEAKALEASGAPQLY